jgi:hypothetical protein
MPEIAVSRQGESTYRVAVRDGRSGTTHEVTVTPLDVQRFAPPGATAEDLVEASFEFLLERESKESILSRFELPVIARYFPEYPTEIRRRLLPRAGPTRKKQPKV